MKNRLLILLTLILSLIFVQCVKEEDDDVDDTENTVTKYDGTYSGEADYASAKVASWKIKMENGKASAISTTEKDDIAVTGSVNKSGVLSGSSSVTLSGPVSITLSGKIENDKVSGTWQDISGTISGTFSGNKE